MQGSTDLGKLVLRVVLGVLILFHGVSKLMHGPGYVLGVVAQAGLPSILAYGVYIGEVAARMAESLVDLVLRAPEEQQAQLLAATMTYVGQAFLEKTGTIAGESNTVQ